MQIRAGVHIGRIHPICKALVAAAVPGQEDVGVAK